MIKYSWFIRKRNAALCYLNSLTESQIHFQVFSFSRDNWNKFSCTHAGILLVDVDIKLRFLKIESTKKEID